MRKESSLSLNGKTSVWSKMNRLWLCWQLQLLPVKLKELWEACHSSGFLTELTSDRLTYNPTLTMLSLKTCWVLNMWYKNLITCRYYIICNWLKITECPYLPRLPLMNDENQSQKLSCTFVIYLHTKGILIELLCVTAKENIKCRPLWFQVIQVTEFLYITHCLVV